MTLFRNDRNRFGGGVACYVKTNLNPIQLNQLDNSYQEQGFETLTIQITCKNENLILITVYKPPQTSVDAFLVLQDLIIDAAVYGKVILLGDLNADLLQPTVNPGKTLLEVLQNCSLYLPINISATRITLQTASCLDIIAVNDLLHSEKYETVPNAASDHMPIMTQLKIATVSSILKPVYKRSFRNIDWRLFNEKIADISLPNTDTGIESLCELWYLKFNEVLDEMAPRKHFPLKRKRCPFVTPDIKELMIIRDNILRKNKGLRLSVADEENLKCLKRQVTSQIRRVAKNEASKAFNSNNPKEAWNYIKQFTFSSKGSDQLHIEPEILNEHFASVVNSAADPESNFFSPINTCSNINGLSFAPTTVEEVKEAITNLKNRNSPGNDELTSFLLKQLCNSIAFNITLLFNYCLKTSTFPQCWKSSNIVCLWKNKGSRSDPSNYRPISLLPIIGRVFEKILSNQLNNFCDNHKVIPDQQFGFRRNSSCESALIKITNDWMAHVDEGKMVGAILIDLSKAFDNVSHHKLLLTLQEINLSNESLQLMFSFLSNRRQRVKVEDKLTDWKKITRGVPQGSCLSPLLFNIYMRNLPLVTNLDTYQYADDITEAAVDTNIEPILDKLNEGFLRTESFCQELELSINRDKTQFIIFKQPSKKIDDNTVMCATNTYVPISKMVKLLGFTLDRHFTFSCHIDATVSKARGILFSLKTATKWLPKQLLTMAYTSLVRSHMEYCNAVFAGAAATHLEKLNITQRIAARVISGAKRDAHAAPLLEALNLKSLEDRRNSKLIKLSSAILNGKCHPALQALLELEEDNNILKDPACRTRIGQRRFAVQAAKAYNI